MLELRAAQVAGNFAKIGAPDLLHLWLSGGLFGQYDLTRDILDVPVTQHHLNREACNESLQVGHAGQGGLTGADEKQLAVEVLAEGLGDLLNLECLFRVAADVLLHLVKNNKGQRELTVYGHGGLDGRGHLLAGDVGGLRKLFFKQLAGVRFGVGQVRTGFQQRLDEVAGDIHVRKFLRQRTTSRLQLGFDRWQDSVALHPQYELCLVVLLR